MNVDTEPDGLGEHTDVRHFRFSPHQQVAIIIDSAHPFVGLQTTQTELAFTPREAVLVALGLIRGAIRARRTGTR